MHNKLLDGKELAENILAELYQQRKTMENRPSVAVLLVGDDPASQLYVKLKEKAARQVDFDFHKYTLEADASQAEIIETIKFLNEDDSVNGILVQLPLPNKDDEDAVIAAIDPKKDVDGFHKANADQKYIIPGLNLGILELIKSSGEKYEDASAAIICNNPLFGESLKKTLEISKIKADFYSAEEYEKNPQAQMADIVIIAIGRPNWLKGAMVKEGSVIIDVGINKLHGKTVGDADFADLINKVEYITPVPGGVGPMTVAMLLENTFNLALKQNAEK